MMLVEQTGVSATSLPVAEFREHLRLGTGFADDGIQDSLLERLLRTAIAVVERRTGKALLQRSYRYTLTAWRGFLREELPVAPVTAISALRIVDPDGVSTTIEPSRYRLEPDAHRPMLSSRGFGLPTVPINGRIEIEFDAGFAPTWDGVPADLAQAVMLLAAHLHENRHALADSGAPMPHGVEALIAAFRPMRLFGRRF